MVRLRHLHTGFYNVNSLKNVLTAHALGHFVVSCNLDILALAQTKLAPGAVPPRMVRGYEWHGNNRSAHGGGVGVLIRSGIAHVRRSDLSGPEESVWVEIECPGGVKGLFGCFYCPAGIVPVSNHVQISLQKAAQEHCFLIVAGDFNYHHVQFGDSRTDRHGDKLLSICDDLGLTVQRSAPTYVNPPHRPSVLDLYVTSDPVRLYDHSVHPPIGLGLPATVRHHFPVTASFAVDPRVDHAPVRHVFDVNRADWALSVSSSQIVCAPITFIGHSQSVHSGGSFVTQCCSTRKSLSRASTSVLAHATL